MEDYHHRVTHLRGDYALASELLPRVHRVVSLLKRWLLGTHHGGGESGASGRLLRRVHVPLQPPSVPARYDQNMVLVVRAAVRYRGRYDAGLLLEMSPVIIIRKRRVNESV